MLTEAKQPGCGAKCPRLIGSQTTWDHLGLYFLDLLRLHVIPHFSKVQAF